MARDPKVTRKAYEYKLGKDLVSKLDDKQIHLLSEYYNSLSDKETSDIDSQIVQGRNNTELHEMAIGMVEENEKLLTQFESGSISDGLYICRLTMETGELFNRKIMLVR